MSDKEVEKSVAEEIDADEGLKSKRKLLTISSLVLLALSFSSARVEEANTFLVKLTFENQDGLGILLVLGVFFLMIRYFNYASKYHQKLYIFWTKRMLNDEFYKYIHPEDGEVYGYIKDNVPEGLDVDYVVGNSGKWGVIYISKLVFFKKIHYWWQCEGVEYSEVVQFGWPHYPKVLLLETKYRLLSFITYRVHLDIFTPYLLGGLAILSFFFHDSFQVLIHAISAFRQ